MNIVFFGTSSFAAEILVDLLHKKFPIVAVVTRPDRPKGRQLKRSPPPVKEVLLQRFPQLPLFQPERASTPEFASILETFSPDLFVIAAYGEIIKQFLLDIPRIACINVHASLLPKYRGAAPIQRALLAGEKETGITIIAMTAQMDAGDMLAQATFSISEEMNAGELEKELSVLGAKLVSDVIIQLEKGTEARIPQDVSKMTLASKIPPEEEKIDWNRPAEYLHNLIRALAPTPGAWTSLYIDGSLKRLKIMQARIRTMAHSLPPGEILSCNPKEWIVACGKEALELLKVQLEGKKMLSAREFLIGTKKNLSFTGLLH